MTVNEYVTKFTQLSRYAPSEGSRYAPSEVDTDEKKQDCFLNDLNDGLVYALEARDFENFKGVVNMTLMLENHRGGTDRDSSGARDSGVDTKRRSRRGGQAGCTTAPDLTAIQCLGRRE
jgi:hypothetical protein